MADTPEITLRFDESCPDCGIRQVDLPAPLPDIGDDFDWLLRDYDGYRRFMLEELIARFPRRTRWTPADMEVVLVEVLAAALDQLSDMMDRTASEAFLETARRPESVRRLLSMIGYDAVLQGGYGHLPRSEAVTALEKQWYKAPEAMERARLEGPAAIHDRKRMVTTDDHANSLAAHPLVQLAHAWNQWSGSWHTIRVAVIGWERLTLDQTLSDIALSGLSDEGLKQLLERIEQIKSAVDAFHETSALTTFDWEEDNPTLRTLLAAYLSRYRMVGREVLLEDAAFVGIAMALSLRISENYFQSEIRSAAGQVLGTGAGGFFSPGLLSFGQDLYASDIVQELMNIEGIETVCLNRFKRVGKRYLDQSDSGHIVLSGLEVAVCDNRPESPENGYYSLTISGGRKG